MGLFVFALLAGTAIVFGASVQQHHGYAWADNVCSMTTYLCSSPGWMAMVTIAMALIYFFKVSLDA